MSNLIERDNTGNWFVKGLPWEKVNVGQTITQEVNEKLYGCLFKLMEYERIGTVKEFEESKEKTEPMKPDYEADGYADGELVYDYAKCPVCGHEFEYDINDWGCEYCSDCGQKLDWK